MNRMGLAIFLAGLCAFLACAQNSPPPTKPGDKPATIKPPAPPQAFLTSKRVVYAQGQPIDLTFAISTGKGSVVPRFMIVNEAGEPVQATQVNGKYFWETPSKSIDGKERQGAIPADRQHTESISDLRQWYSLDAPGNYEVTFDGEWNQEDSKDQPQAITSNTILIRIAAQAGENGEPENIEGHEIPLSEIWALDMPGTKPMDTSGPSADPPVFMAPEGKIVSEIVHEALQGNKNALQPARSGFIVQGTGMQALREAHAVLAEHKPARTVFRAGESVTLVFFSKSFSRYVHLKQVVDHGSIISVSYELVSHMTFEATSHLALVPLQLNHVGKVRFEMKPVSKDPMPDLGRYIDRTISKPFEIEVQN